MRTRKTDHITDQRKRKALEINPCPNTEEWYRAMSSKVKSILKNNTWELVKCPEGGQVIRSHMVLRNKYDPNGTLGRRKARVLVRGFVQQPAYLKVVLGEEIFMEVPHLSSKALEIIGNTEAKESDIIIKAKTMLNALQTGNKVCKLKKIAIQFAQGWKKLAQRTG